MSPRHVRRKLVCRDLSGCRASRQRFRAVKRGERIPEVDLGDGRVGIHDPGWHGNQSGHQLQRGCHDDHAYASVSADNLTYLLASVLTLGASARSS